MTPAAAARSSSATESASTSAPPAPARASSESDLAGPSTTISRGSVSTTATASSYSASHATSAPAPASSAACRNSTRRLVLYEYATRVRGQCARHAAVNVRRFELKRATSATHTGELTRAPRSGARAAPPAPCPSARAARSPRERHRPDAASATASANTARRCSIAHASGRERFTRIVLEAPVSPSPSPG